MTLRDNRTKPNVLSKDEADRLKEVTALVISATQERRMGHVREPELRGLEV